MQATMHSNPSLPALLRLTAKARETFERLRRPAEQIVYRIERVDGAGEFRWKVVAPGSSRAVALRRTKREALQACERLECRASK
ncbi:hypothetical protein [Pseudomonas nicosulfuronedens]